jgi:hypothetical protein
LEIEKFHTSYVTNLMKESETMSLDELKDISTKYDSMYFHNNSNKAARNLFLYLY